MPGMSFFPPTGKYLLFSFSQDPFFVCFGFHRIWLWRFECSQKRIFGMNLLLNFLHPPTNAREVFTKTIKTILFDATPVPNKQNKVSHNLISWVDCCMKGIQQTTISKSHQQVMYFINVSRTLTYT